MLWRDCPCLFHRVPCFWFRNTSSGLRMTPRYWLIQTTQTSLCFFIQADGRAITHGLGGGDTGFEITLFGQWK